MMCLGLFFLECDENQASCRFVCQMQVCVSVMVTESLMSQDQKSEPKHVDCGDCTALSVCCNACAD